MIGLYRIIKDDLFGIAKRLKAIDKDYFVVYSYRDHRYEVHNKGNKGNTYCFFADKLDERIVVRARQTRRERIKELLAQIERDNGLLVRQELHNVRKSLEFGVEAALSGGGQYVS